MKWLFVPGVSGVGVGGRAGYTRGLDVVVVAAGVHDVCGGGFGVLAHGGGNLFSGTGFIELDGSEIPFPEYEVRSDREGVIGNVRTGGDSK